MKRTPSLAKAAESLAFDQHSALWSLILKLDFYYVTGRLKAGSEKSGDSLGRFWSPFLLPH